MPDLLLLHFLHPGHRDQRDLCSARHEWNFLGPLHTLSLPSGPRRCRCALVPLRYTLCSAAAPLPPADRRPTRFAGPRPQRHIAPFHSASLISAMRFRAFATRPEPTVTNVRYVPPPGLLVVSLTPFRPRPVCCTARAFVTNAARSSHRTRDGFRLRLGSGVSLRLRSARHCSPSALHFPRLPTRRPKPTRSQSRTQPRITVCQGFSHCSPGILCRTYTVM